MSLCVSSLRRLFVLAVLGSWLLPGSAHALQEKEIDEKEGMEVFEEEDPYTKGDAVLVKALGYVRLGHGAWHGGDDTKALQQNMGGIEVLFGSLLHNIVASCLTTTFMDRHNGTAYTMPRWFVYGMSYLQLRRVGPEWTYADGRQPGQGQDKDQWDWEPRVYKLVKNEFFTSAQDMFAGQDYPDLHQRDHMIAWSKTEFLVTELEGDSKAFLYAVCRQPSKYGSNIGDQGLVERQVTALRECFNLTPEQFDEAWAKWVLKNYRRK